MPTVLLVARTNAAGLAAAQRALIEWASGVAVVELAGLVLSADAPGKLPRALADQATQVGGGSPRVWSLPWCEPWRLGRADTTGVSRAARRTLQELALLTADADSPTDNNQG